MNETPRFVWLTRSFWNWKRVLLALFGSILLFELIGLIIIWPDWEALRQGKVPESAVIQDYKEQREDDPKLPRVQWTPLQRALPNHVKKAFILAEDSRFYEHGGVDFQAIKDAMEYNWKKGKIILGASTISQQTAKNMFLSLSRNPLRKFHELFLTWLLEYKLSKAEILHIYLNIAEFGKGVYGIEAASRYYFHTSAHNLSSSQAAELAASLPSPKKHNPRTRTRFFTKHVARLSRTLQIADQYAAQQGRKTTPEGVLVSNELAKKLQELRELNSEENEQAAEATDTAALPVPAAAPTETPSEETTTDDTTATAVTAGTPAVEPAPADTPTPVPTPTADAEPEEEVTNFQLE